MFRLRARMRASGRTQFEIEYTGEWEERWRIEEGRGRRKRDEARREEASSSPAENRGLLTRRMKLLKRQRHVLAGATELLGSAGARKRRTLSLTLSPGESVQKCGFNLFRETSQSAISL